MYKLLIAPEALKQLQKLGKSPAKQILDWLEKNVDGSTNPKANAKPLQHGYKGLWRYRIAKDYRVICDIQDDQLVVLALKVGHRSKIYKLKR